MFEGCEKAQKILFNFEVPGNRDFKGREWQPETQKAVAGRTGNQRERAKASKDLEGREESRGGEKMGV